MSNVITPVWTTTRVEDRLMRVSFDREVDADWLVEANAVSDEWAHEIGGQTWGQVSFHAGEIHIADVNEATSKASLTTYITDLIDETTSRRWSRDQREFRIAASLRTEVKAKARIEAKQQKHAAREARKAANRERKQALKATRKQAEDAARGTPDEQLQDRFRDAYSAAIRSRRAAQTRNNLVVPYGDEGAPSADDHSACGREAHERHAAIVDAEERERREWARRIAELNLKEANLRGDRTRVTRIAEGVGAVLLLGAVFAVIGGGVYIAAVVVGAVSQVTAGDVVFVLLFLGLVWALLMAAS